MALTFISSRLASSNVRYNINIDNITRQYIITSLSGVTMFKAESEKLALYGIRCIGKIDVFGLLITESGFKHYNGKIYNS